MGLDALKLDHGGVANGYGGEKEIGQREASRETVTVIEASPGVVLIQYNYSTRGHE